MTGKGRGRANARPVGARGPLAAADERRAHLACAAGANREDISTERPMAGTTRARASLARFQADFDPGPAPDVIRGGDRFASIKRVQSRI
jgi:hypothetical protein